DAGGWSAATLTEDLDLSYRAQLRGWRSAYLEDVIVPEELPVSIDAYRRQQSRWATGSFQCAFSLLGALLWSRNRAVVKVEAAIHLLAYAVGPLMLIQVACYPLLLVTASHYRLPWPLAYASMLAILVGITPWICFMVAQTRRGRSWWSGAHSILFQVVGAGMSLNTLIALVRARRRGGEFVRTPKHRIVERGQEWRDQAYVRVGDPRAAAEAILGVAALAIVASTGSLHDPLFGMEDTWLPGYHVLAAAVLHVFGLWQLGALKALGAVLGMATLACVYCIAPNARQGRLAVILLALNPVFLFTSGSAVVEPLLTTLLAGAALAGVR